MNLLEVTQGSEEWKLARVGSLGASCLHEVVAKTKTGWAASRANRMAALVVEQLTGLPQDTYQNAAMQHGIETEPEARTAYEFMTNSSVKQIGLVRHPDIGGTHASPDGLIGNDGSLEIKCPQPAQHLSTLIGEPIASKYVIQMQWQMRCCDRAWCDFVSYCPAFPGSMSLFIKRVERDDKLIVSLEADVIEFLNELRLTVHRLRSKYEPDSIERGELLAMAG